MQHAFDERVAAGGVDVTVTGGLVRAAAVHDAVATSITDKVPARLAASDPTLWGPDAESEAAVRLGWVDLPASSRALLPQLAELREQVRAEGLDHVVLAGMGGSSLAPEVIAAVHGVPLTVVDTTDADQVRRALRDRTERTVVVVASKSGGTIETDSHRRAFEGAFRDAGLTPSQVAARIVVVTDPGTPLEKSAREAGYTVVLADPNVGGRYSALTAFGLVPSALAGADVARLLDEAAALAPALGTATDNPGLLLGAALGAAAASGRDKLVLFDGAGGVPGGPVGAGLSGFGDWAEQLIAESTGKQGRGILPVVVEGFDAPGITGRGADAVVAFVGAAGGGVQGADAGDTSGTSNTADAADAADAADTADTADAVDTAGAPAGDGTSAAPFDIAVTGPLGAQFLLWEYATAVAGRVLGIDPFDQPNVQESKDNTAKLLGTLADEGTLPEGTAAFVDGGTAVHADADLLGGAATVQDALRALLAAVPERGYLAVMAYLDRGGDTEAPDLRPLLARALGDRQATFGWAPRFLHSTGQFHKGGPQVGAFLQITSEVTEDLPVPGRPYTFAQLQKAQALGDLGALAARGRPVLRLHLLDPAEALAGLLSDARALEGAA
ncbi:glucose-6-phosphate isomerase [Yinghuangia sp. YIM S09857]|uniref:glucose-6-phosphate isomerase n=1 Tax=Yinghuangia sp. YIM S09857 TaxID=3436929 RepID=UPI003F53CB3B